MNISSANPTGADQGNWLLAPHNRWTFQCVERFTRTRRVTAPAQPSPLSRRDLDINSLTFIDSSGQQATIIDMLDRSYTDGFLVMQAGDVLCEQYFNGMEADTPHLMMSCSKSLTSTLVGIAVAGGQLDLQAQVSYYLPELAESAMADATVQQVLDMQVGVVFDEDYANFNGHWRDLEVATGWRSPPPDYDGPLDMLSYMRTLVERDGEHGRVFHYQSVLTDVLGLCLERATHRDFFELCSEQLWHPLGMEHDLVAMVDAAGYAIFEGGFNCCLRDFARFASMICAGGRIGDKQVVPGDWIDDCRFPGEDLVTAFAASKEGEGLPGHAYHNQWWVRDPHRGVIMALGIHGQTLYIDPEREFLVAKFSSQPEHDDLEMAVDQMLAFEELANASTC